MIVSSSLPSEEETTWPLPSIKAAKCILAAGIAIIFHPREKVSLENSLAHCLFLNHQLEGWPRGHVKF